MELAQNIIFSVMLVGILFNFTLMFFDAEIYQLKGYACLTVAICAMTLNAFYIEGKYFVISLIVGIVYSFCAAGNLARYYR